MRLLWAVLALAMGWAQEESRTRQPTGAPPATRSVPVRSVPRPAQEEVVIMETLSGKVLDKKGNPAAGVRIWFVNKATGQVLGETRTDEQGNFALAIQRADTLVVRLSREGKEFVEHEYTIEQLTTTEPEIPFVP
ncbi:MAG: carboxypeptidase regulatory-like domain-containing protein [Bacteroidetes bacterium]|nr:MAG: carboxypeptidase regulatory-like domain-containing protein [Bacteroidota bacterium]